METIVLVDDINGRTDGVKKRSFGLEGITYDIDLCDDNMAMLRKDLAPWLAVARLRPRQKPTGHKPKTTRKASNLTPAQMAKIHQWASHNPTQTEEPSS